MTLKPNHTQLLGLVVGLFLFILITSMYSGADTVQAKKDLKCVKIIDSGQIKNIILYNQCDECMKAEMAWYGRKKKTSFQSFKVKANSREKVKLKSSNYELVNEFSCD